MMAARCRAAASRRRGAAQLVLVMLVILVIGVAATGAVRRSISVRRADEHRKRSQTLERALDAGQQWVQAGGDVGPTDVTLQLPSDSNVQQATVVLHPVGDDQLRMTATLTHNGRSVAKRSRILDDGSE